MPALDELATKPFDEGRTYSDVVHFVNIYVPEPHPMSPDPSPYFARVNERVYSEVRQPRTYDERVSLAREVSMLLEGDQLMLVDEMPPLRNNPVWCSYGPMPNLAYLIDRTGTVRLAQQWEDPPKIEAAIDELLGKPAASPAHTE